MRLSKLTLAGFKSFADRTEFTFDAPITGVVGPNGCGKSNVVDAIKWVLGERSAKSLRSKEMADVIFAGSAGRRPLGMASVTLTFENPLLDSPLEAAADAPPEPEIPGEAVEADAGAEPDEERAFERPLVRKRSLPIDAETVDVERRLHRDGTSEYFINSRRARLRDIRELFLDTGVGADAYSIIEQGKVDAMLIASPLERRGIFEEAAGVAKFKARRIEAQRKLERAEQSLAVMREQLASAERRLRIVKGQAAKARRFKDLDTAYRGLRMALAFDQHHGLVGQLEGLTSRLQQLESERAAAASELAEAEDAKQQAELLRREIQQAEREIEGRLTEAQHAARSAEQRRTLTERSLEDARRQIEVDRQRLRAAEDALDRLGAAWEELSASVGGLETRLAEAEKAARSAAEERASANSQLAEQRSQQSERQSAAARIDRDRAALLARLEGDRRRSASLAEQSSRLDERLGGLRAERGGAAERLEAAHRQHSEREKAVEAAENELRSVERSAGELAGEQRQLADLASRLEQRRASLDGRRATLREMAEARAGFGDAVRSALERRDAEGPDGPLSCIVAPLAELIDVDAAHAAAVEAALGADLQALVVRSASEAIDRGALAELSGRVTFLACDLAAAGDGAKSGNGLVNAMLPEVLGVAPERLVALTSVVRAQGCPAGIVHRLLGRTFLVESLESAVMLAALARSRGVGGARFVTRAGEVLGVDGRLVAGPAGGEDGAGAGVLQRRTELAELDAQLVELDADLSGARGRLASIDERAAELDATLSGLRKRLAEEQRSLVADHAAADRIEAELARLDRETPRLEEELASTRERIAAMEREHEELAQKAESLGRLHAEQAELAQQAAARAAELQSALDSATERVSAARVAATQRSEELNTARREARRTALEREQAEAERGRLAQHEAQALARAAEHEGAIAEAASAIAEAARVAEAAGAELASARERLLSAEEQCGGLSKRLGAARERSRIVERDWQAVEIARREVEIKRENLEQRAMEDLSLDLGAERAEYAALMASGGVEPIDQAAVAKEIEELREEIRRLGNVNLDAIDEEQSLESRNEELVRQIADIDAAKASLEELITRLSDLSRTRFKETFESIQAHFGGDDGMFRRLFGGGKAEVRLIPNPETGEIDWLESGVEVVAKPPGKEPRAISQLSGGEKTLTAIALLLAIFHSKPSAFCMLDEVDAALDEANVARFCNVLKQMVDHSQVIVITHNKRTMQSATQLYGVTMQERGVSTRVSVRLDRVSADGSITTRTGPAPEPAEAAAANGHTGPDPVAAGAVSGKRRKSSLREQLAAMREGEAPAALNGSH